MLKRNTVFVIGAGASSEAGLPVGQQLMTRIADILNIRFQHGYEQLSGSRLAYDALRRRAQSENLPDTNLYLQAGWTIRDAAPLALSIDNFIDAHRDDKKIELCGKLAIAEAILSAERESALFVDRRKQESLDHRPLGGTWYPRLVQLLTENVGKSEIHSLFERVTFVIFNYDRCVEHFLCEALARYYALNPVDAQSLLKGARFVHPYGIVGSLEWQDGMGITFGADVGSQKLLQVASQLRTFTEQFTDEGLRNSLASVVEKADTLVFLGFAFHEQNMELLRPSQRGATRRIFAT